MNFRARARGQHLAKNYLEVGHGSDPLVAILRGMNGKAAQEQVIRLCDVIGKMPPWYLETFYRKPELKDEVAVLLADSSSRMIVNFYYHDPETRVEKNKAQLTDSYYLLVARLVRAHFALNTDVVSAGPLSILSDRERQVCEGILSGRKSEMIAANIGIAPNSVVTYRRRAYSKLGINSRADLFALCRK